MKLPNFLHKIFYLPKNLFGKYILSTFVKTFKTMEQKINEIEINGVKYVAKDSVKENAPNVDGMPLVLIRGYGSGVQFGYLSERNGCEVKLINSRRIWSWNKATECSQIAVNGIDAANSKVTVIAPEKCITDAIEIITITKEAGENLINQPIWKK